MEIKGKLIRYARRMRRAPTSWEEEVWTFLRGRRMAGVRFRRQEPIGPYIADFLSYDPKMVIELDGPHHQAQIAYDLQRKQFLQAEGFAVLRIGSEVELGWDFGTYAAIQKFVLDQLAK